MIGLDVLQHWYNFLNWLIPGNDIIHFNTQNVDFPFYPKATPMLPIPFLIITVIQIIAEMLPISSSGHIKLFQLATGATLTLPHHFDEFLHLFSLLVLAVYFRRTWIPMVRRLWRVVFSRTPQAHRFTHHTLKLIALITIVTLCTAVGYYGGRLFLKGQPWLTSPVTLGIGFVITALLLITSSRTLIPNPSFPLLVICMAVAQSLAALLPGVSRFAITYATARWLGRTPRRALQLSWLMITPLIAVAVTLHGLGDFMLGPDAGVALQPAFWITAALATAASYAALCGVARLAVTNRLWWIGVYMLLPISALIILNW